jgi:hypothetical protein
MSKLSDKLKGLFAKTRNAPGKGAYPKAFEQKAFKAGQKTSKLLKGLSFSSKIDKPASASKALVTASAAKKLRAASKIAKIGRAVTPVGLGLTAANLVYDVATMSPEKKAKVKKLKTKLSKTSTKDYHADLLKMSTGGDTMLKNPKKADLDKDGKLSGYEKKRAKAIESNMKQKPIKAVLGIAAMGLLGAKALKDKKNKTTGPILMPQDRKNQTTGLMPQDRKNQQQPQTTGQQQASKGKMMKAYKGDMAKGYGAARTQGQGLQDENLIPGKSLDYYKDIM